MFDEYNFPCEYINMTCSDVITETAHVYFQTKTTISKMDRVFLAECLAAIFLLNSADFYQCQIV